MTLPPESLSALRDLLARYCGVLLDDARLMTLRSAVERRAEAVRRAPAQYVADLALSADRAELQQLAELLLNHETVFFRIGPILRRCAKPCCPPCTQPCRRERRSKSGALAALPVKNPIRLRSLRSRR